MDRTTLKSWFQRGKKPTASQFAALIDSFWHKDDTMSLHSIKGLNEALQTISGKQDKTDTTLQTADKTVVGAINEVNTKTSNIEREIGNEDLLSDHAQSIKGAIAEINTWRGNASQDIEHLVGDMPFKQDKTDTTLQTADKTVVGAINEVNTKTSNIEREIGNEDLLSDHAQSIKGAIAEINTWRGNASQDIEHLVGDMPFKQDKTDTTLQTADKTVVGAINEIWGKVKELWNRMTDYLKGIYHVTYTELRELRTNSELVPGRWYRITDYMTTVANDPEARSAGHPFDVLVMATDVDTLSEEARAVKSSRKDIIPARFYSPSMDAWFERDEMNDGIYNGEQLYAWKSGEEYAFTKKHIPENNDDVFVAFDIEGNGWGTLSSIYTLENFNEIGEDLGEVINSKDYFADANLNAWKVWYCIDNDATRFQWADTENGKGVIWRMIDEWQNDCPYDFKNVQFKRYRASVLNEAIEDAIDGQYYAYNGEMNNVEIADEDDFVWAYTFVLIDENAQWVDYSIKKEGALDSETDWGYLHQFKKGRCESNHIRNTYTAITIDEVCHRTLVLNNIVLISTFTDCELSGEMQLNEFGTGNYNMTVKDNPEKNVFGNKCYNNIVGSYGNTFGNDCGGNTFGNYFQWNTFGNNCRYITVHNGVQYVSITGGNTDSSYVQNAQILNGTRGSDTSNKLQISFQEDADYCQYAGLNSSGDLRIWTPADTV